MWFSMVALAAPCEPEAVASIQTLEAAMDEVEGPLREVLPSLAEERPPRVFATDGGAWYGLGLVRSDCTLPDGRAVLVASGPPLPGSGVAQPDRFGVADLLVVGSHDASRDGWDRAGFLSIVAHEWTHVHHATTDPNASAYRGQHKLEKQFVKDETLQKAAIELLKASLDVPPGSCELGKVKARYQQVLAAVKPKNRELLERWMFTEGLGRYVEARVEARLRGADEDEQIERSCTSIDDGNFAYAVGCSVARALQRCDRDVWAAPMVGPFGAMLEAR